MDLNNQTIIEYVDRRFEEQDIKLSAEFFELKTMIANLSGQVQTYHQELLVSNHRLDRLEGWGKMVGNKVNIPLSF